MAAEDLHNAGVQVPAFPPQQRAEELEAAGRLRPGRPGGLASRRPLSSRTGTPPLSQVLDAQRRAEDR